MPNDKDAQIIVPPNTLKARLGTGGGMDSDAIKRAEQAMTRLQTEFSDWLADDITRLTETFAAFKAGPAADTASALFRAAHDLKGQAATFEYPLIARVAGSLAKLIDELKARETAPLPLVSAHVDAIHVIHRDQIKDASNHVALVLTEELEGKVRVALARDAHQR